MRLTSTGAKKFVLLLSTVDGDASAIMSLLLQFASLLLKLCLLLFASAFSCIITMLHYLWPLEYVRFTQFNMTKADGEVSLTSLNYLFDLIP